MTEKDELLKQTAQEYEKDIKTDSVQNASEPCEENETDCAKDRDRMTEKSKKTSSDSLNGKSKIARFFANDIVKCTLVLVVIAVVAGVLLGVINWATYVDPNSVIIGKVAAFYGVSSERVEMDETLGNYEHVNSCFVAKAENGDIAGYCYYSVGTGAKDGTMELLVYIDVDGVIKEVAVYEQGETAGYFSKVEKANKPKYVGLDVDEIDALVLVKNADAIAQGEVSAVSQCTYTSTGYHNGIAAAVNAYKQAKEGGAL